LGVALCSSILQILYIHNDAGARQQLEPEELIGKALCLRYTENRAGIYKGEAANLITRLAKHIRNVLNVMILVLFICSRSADTRFSAIDQSTGDAYRANSHVHPMLMTDLATIICRSAWMHRRWIYKSWPMPKVFEFWQLSAEVARKPGNY